MRVNSHMIDLGTKAVDFTLADTVSGQQLNLSHYAAGQPVLIAFICNHCPFVVHIIERFAAVVAEYQKKGIQCIAISANDIEEYPQDAPDKMTAFAQQYQLSCPYCFDETQQVAKSYQAACTPDFYLFDSDLHCVYRGRFDAATPGNEAAVTGHDLCAAMDQLLLGKEVDQQQYPSMGCNIKWRQEVDS